MQKNVYSVSKINAYIKNLFLQDYVLNDLWISGEISNYKVHSSGHVYFTLKDQTGAMACVLFKRYTEYLPCELEEGMHIVAKGYVSVYERSGQYQLYVQQVKLDGIGALYQRFEALKNKLSQEGLFDATYKKNMPKYPKKIGIVTSSTGAAIRDMVNVAKRRNPYVSLILYPSLVQGVQASKNIIKGINYFDQMEDIDVIIIGRGGGSIEDLWAFNDETLAKTIFDAKTPIISGVGHETDFTIADFVADLRAPTPSAAAELAVPSIEAIYDEINQYQYKLTMLMNHKMNASKNKIHHLNIRLNYVNPNYKLEQYQQYLIEIENRLRTAIQSKLKDYQYQLGLLNEKLKARSPLSHLNKGYALVEDTDGKSITSIKNADKNQLLRLLFSDGILEVIVKDKKEKRWDYNEE